MVSTDLHWHSIGEISQLLKSGEVSSVELTQNLLERIRVMDPALHSYAVVLEEEALVNAARAARELSLGRNRGALHGVPIAIKDLCDTRGTTTAAGMSILQERIPNFDSTVVKRLVGAGAVIIGKLALTQGASASYDRAVHPVRNPWNLDHWSGASSSGSASATAAGLCYGSIGSDTGGSIRVPSACCGIVGLKPTYGRVSRAGVFPLAATLDHVGPMVRSVSDAAIMLQAIAGYDPDDKTSSRVAVPDYSRDLNSSLQGLRVGIDEAYVTHGIDPELTRALFEALSVLEDLGANVVRVDVPYVDESVAALNVIFQGDVAQSHSDLYALHSDSYGAHLRTTIERARTRSAEDYATAHQSRLICIGSFGELFESIDVLLCAPSLGPAPSLEDMRSRKTRLKMQEALRLTAPFNISGLPALTVPCGFAANDLPLACQLVGRPFEEALLLRVGNAYETSQRWHNHHPKVLVSSPRPPPR